jgi:hypothetical protein
MHPNPTLESRLECYVGGYDLRVAAARRDLHVRRFVAFVAPEMESEATLDESRNSGQVTHLVGELCHGNVEVRGPDHAGGVALSASVLGEYYIAGIEQAYVAVACLHFECTFEAHMYLTTRDRMPIAIPSRRTLRKPKAAAGANADTSNGGDGGA